MPRGLLGLSGRQAAAFLGVCLVGMAACVSSGMLHDYRFYVEQWAQLLAGEAVFGRGGAVYGPAYNLLAGPYSLHPLLPKVLFCAAWLATLWFVLKEARSRSGGPMVPWVVLVLLGLNPLFWIHAALYGNFDILVAAFALAAVVLQERERSAWGGAVLAIAVLLKFYPAALMPFLVFSRRRADLRFLGSFAIVLALGLLLGATVWGPESLTPLLFAADRASTQLSIFRFLRGYHSPLAGPDGHGLDALSVPLAILMGLVVFGIACWRGFRSLPGAVAGMLTVLTFYKVGHAQFHMLVVVLLAYGYATDPGLRLGHLRLKGAAALYMLFLGAYTTLYEVTRYLSGAPTRGLEGEWAAVREVAGIPAFLLGLLLVWEIIRWEWSPPCREGS